MTEIHKDKPKPSLGRFLQYSLRTLLVLTAVVAVGVAPFVRRKKAFDRIALTESPLSAIHFHEDCRLATFWQKAGEWLGGKEWVFEIEEIACQMVSIQQEQLNAIADCLQIESLAFSISNRHVDLAFLESLSSLESLDVHFSGYAGDAEPRSPELASLTDVLPHLKSLRNLNLWTDYPGNSLFQHYCTAEDLREVAGDLDQLEMIEIDAEIPDEYVLAFKDCSSLKNVGFHSPKSTEAAFLAYIHHPGVKFLSVQQSGVGVYGKYVFRFNEMVGGHQIVSFNHMRCVIYRGERPDITEDVVETLLVTNWDPVRTLQCEGDWCDLEFMCQSGVELPDDAIAFLNGQSVGELDTDINGVGVFPAIQK